MNVQKCFMVDKEAKLAEETAKKTFEERSTGSELPAVKIKQTSN